MKGREGVGQGGISGKKYDKAIEGNKLKEEWETDLTRIKTFSLRLPVVNFPNLTT